MRKVLWIMTLMSLAGIVNAEPGNPFFQEWNTPYEVPPFDLIELEHYEPAIMEGMALQNSEIEAITSDPEPATFANTIEALDDSGRFLTRASTVFNAMLGTMNSDELQEIANRLAPLRSQHRDGINLNVDLFKRVDAVYGQKDDLDLSTEQRTLLKETWKSFVRGGANLKGQDREEFSKINEELSVLSLQFGQNVLNETNRFEMVIDDETFLEGLPAGSIEAAAEEATRRDKPGTWVFTLHKPSLIPFLQYSPYRDLRETMFKGYINVGDHGDDLDNKEILTRMASLRVLRANLLGFPTHAAYVLDDNMAKNPENVFTLLNEIWVPALERAKEEAAEFQAMIDAEGGNFQLAAWDWWYYAEKVKKARYDLDEAMLRPYFEVERVRLGMFETVNRLWGLTFVERDDLPVYHEDVKVYEVLDADGSLLAIWYSDYFPRASKRGGAWMSSFRKEYYQDGKRVIPVIYNVGNFTKPTADKPALLSPDEVGTMYHEFGHALHGMFSDCQYVSLSGTSVPRDFVEMPSQVMENWAFEPEVLAYYAQHYETGETIPAEYIARMEESKNFNMGFTTVEYLAASFLDMDWHTRESLDEADAVTFEAEALGRIGLIDEIVSRYRSPYFRHIFAGGYSAGYYSYIWSEVYDADAYAAFQETGNIFDPEVALAFRKDIFERGGSDDAMTLYKNFRGRAPEIEPLLKKKGLE